MTRLEKNKKIKKDRRGLRLTLKIIFLVTMLLILTIVGYFFLTYKDDIFAWSSEAKEQVEESKASDFRPANVSYIYDKDENQLAKLSAAEKNIYLKYADIPEAVVDALVAIEDRSFWKNQGYDMKGILRVVFNYIRTDGETVNGASTITQQLARKIYLTNEVSIERKLKEIMYSVEITKKYSKQEIMEFYINNCCFANNIYGIEAASEAYFGISASELSLSQAAYLCAIPNRPTYYDPYVDSSRALVRRDKILKDMEECGYISSGELASAMNETITIMDKKDKAVNVVNNYQTTYAINCAVKYLMVQEDFPFRYDFESEEAYEDYQELYETRYAEARDSLYTGGYKIYTTLDSGVQGQLQTIIDENLNRDDSISESGMYDFQGAMTVIDNSSGKVIAVVGGRSQDEFSKSYTLNRAYQSYRQPGSSIKPLAVYAPALMKGYTPQSTLQNIDVSAAKKSKDVSSMSGASFSLRSAVEQSKNGCAYQLFNEIGPEYGLSFLKEMQFDRISPIDETLSASLGGLTHGVTTEQMAGAYASLVNSGVYRETTCITSMKNIDGEDIYEDGDNIRVYSDGAASTMIDIMQGVIKQGTASSMKWASSSKVEAAGKTGTTNDSKDGWFCGATPYFTVSVWVGYDMPKKLSSLYGSSYPATIWKESMLALLEEYEYTQGGFYQDEISSGDGEEFLPGRSDNEELSSGYTVGDYRADREVGKSINAIVQQMNALDRSAPDFQSQKDALYQQGCGLVNTIYSTKYTTEMQQTLDSANAN